MLVFAAATQGFFFAKSRKWESLALLLVAFTLFRPGYWMDMVIPAVEDRQPSELIALAEVAPDSGKITIKAFGMTIEGDEKTRVISVALGDRASGIERLRNFGVEFREEDSKIIVDQIGFDSPAQKAGLDFDWEILAIQVKTDRPPKQVLYFPAILLLGFVILLQRRRQTDGVLRKE